MWTNTHTQTLACQRLPSTKMGWDSTIPKWMDQISEDWAQLSRSIVLLWSISKMLWTNSLWYFCWAFPAWSFYLVLQFECQPYCSRRKDDRKKHWWTGVTSSRCWKSGCFYCSKTSIDCPLFGHVLFGFWFMRAFWPKWPICWKLIIKTV